MRADDAEPSDHACRPETDIALTGDIVEMNPRAVGPLYDALGTENRTVGVGVFVEEIANLANFFLGELLGGFSAPAREHLVGMVMMVVVSAVALTVMMVVMLVLVVIIVIVIVMVVMTTFVVVIVVMMVVLMFIVIIVVMMATLVVVVIVIVVMVAALAVVVIVMMVMVAALAFVMMVMRVFVVIFVFIMCICCLPGKTREFFFDGVLTLHGFQKFFPVEEIPVGRDNGGVLVVLAEKCDALGDFRVGSAPRVAEDDTPCILDLVAVEFPEVLDIHFALVHIGDRGKSVQNSAVCARVLHRTDDIREFPDPGRFNHDSLGSKVGEDLSERFSKIADERATNATRVHLVDLHAGILQKAAVNADLAELVLNQDDFLALIRFTNQFLDEGGFPRAQETGNNVNFGHDQCLLFLTVHYNMVGKKVKK